MSGAPILRIKRLPHAQGLDLPAYQTAGAAGADLRAAIEAPLRLSPMQRASVPTGLVLEIPDGFEVQLRPRSGLAARHGVTLVNTPGTVDSDYRGEIAVLLVNLGSEPVTIERAERIAQMVLAPVVRASFEEVDEVSDSARGSGGFGSTGR